METRPYRAGLLWLLAAASAVPVPAVAECIVGASVNVREAPRPDARVAVVLPIRTEVSRDERAAQDGWVPIVFFRRVDDAAATAAPVRGWVRAELVAEHCPWYEGALEKAEPGGTDAASWYERAAALARSRAERIAALEGWLRTVGTADPAASRIRAELAAVRDPARQARTGPERSLAVAVVKQDDGSATLYPLTFVGPELASLLPWPSQRAATDFLIRHLHEGRTFRLVSDGAGGSVTIVGDPTFETLQQERDYSIEAGGRLALARGEKGRSWIAASGELRSVAKGRPLTPQERKELVRLAGPRFVAGSTCPQEPAREAAARRALPSGKATGFAKDLDGDGTPELVGLVDFHSTRAPLDGHVLVIARRADDESYRAEHVWGGASIPGGDEEWSYQLLGSADLNADGKEELVIAWWGYAGASIQILIPGDGAYRALTVAVWAS